MTNALEVKKQSPLQEIRATMESKEMREQIKMALPPHIQVEKFIRVVTTAIANDAKLTSANRMSLYNSCMKCAADGLVPDGKEAALVTFGEQVTYMPMVAGVLKKLRNSGELAMIDAQVVYEHDKFVYRPGLDQVPSFEPNWFGKRGEPIGVYAVAKTKEGDSFVEIMNKEQVGAIRNVARTKAVWDGPFGTEMWRKSAIRRLAKRLPSSTDLESFIEKEDELVDPVLLKGDDLKTKDPVPETSSRLAAAIVATKPVVAPAPAAPVTKEPDESPLTEAEEQGLPI